MALPSCLAPHTDGQVGVSLAWVSLSVAGCDALGCPCLAAHLSSARWASELSLPPGQVPGSLVNSSPPQGQVAVWTEQGYEGEDLAPPQPGWGLTLTFRASELLSAIWGWRLGQQGIVGP